MELMFTHPHLMVWGAAIIVMLMIMSAFFSATETAMTGASSAVIHRASVNGDRRADVVADMQSNKSRMIAGLLLGNNLANVCASTLSTAILISLYGDGGILIATVLMTVLLLIFCEVLPKAYALRSREQFALRFAWLLRGVLFLLAPATKMIEIIIGVLFRSDKQDGSISADGEERKEAELRGIIDLHHDGTQGRYQEREMLHSILDMDDMIVEKIMTHRAEVKMINADITWDSLLRIAQRSHYSRLPVFKDTEENIIGVLLVRRLLGFEVKNRDSKVSKAMWEKLMHPVWFIPNYTSLLEQLQSFRRRREHFAVVVDEYGTLQGIVTLEDVLEEIVGEIEDENEASGRSLSMHEDGSITVAGDTSIREINRKFRWNLPDDDAATAAGLLMMSSQSVPETGQTFTFYNYRFRVLKKARQRLMLLRIIPESGQQTDTKSSTH